MEREKFMQDAREISHKILEGKENSIMNLVQQAWAEGKRNAEVETLRSAMDEVINKYYDSKKQNEEANVYRWISVNERLPEKGGYYITYGDEGIKIRTFFLESYFSNSKHVTHWMPLPEVPKEYAAR